MTMHDGVVLELGVSRGFWLLRGCRDVLGVGVENGEVGSGS